MHEVMFTKGKTN
jgi:hypothetical protein